MEKEDGKVLVMYDVRGIQNYIFRTAKVKDAIGASAIVDGIILEALSDALKKLKKKGDLDESEWELEWDGPTGILPYTDSAKKVQVLYIGGGNGYILCENKRLCEKINKIMSKYVIEKTYSLQLAIAMVKWSGDYIDDYGNLMEEMSQIKSKMLISRPLGALPVMRVEVKTGYPVAADQGSAGKRNNVSEMGTESVLKENMEYELRLDDNKQMKIFDNYTTKKGTDSTIAIVHIDGNNMGMRIREQIDDLPDHTYETAVNTMRKISYQIKNSYRAVFDDMRRLFNENSGRQSGYESKKTDDFVLKILVAGDDITYVCNSRIALATVDYFCQEITNIDKYSMAVADKDKGRLKYGFNFCAGIAYINSHFPFRIGYEVAEACCKNAKKYAKMEKYCKDDRVGSWVDFQICKNIQVENLKKIREQEYTTNHGEQLLLRPYFICTDEEGWPIVRDNSQSLSSLKENILYFQNEDNIPRSFAKDLRNTYSQGKNNAEMLMSFLKSRKLKMPGESNELYEEEKCEDEKESKILVARWYDALEMMDYYIDLEQIKGGE